MNSDPGPFVQLSRTGALNFRTTHWSVVLSAARPADDGQPDAFARLYVAYWPPLYAYVRRRGYTPTEAEDITQDFFVCLIEKQRLAGLEQEGGRFRSFLVRSLDHFLANLWDRHHAQKRGAGVRPLSLNVAEGENQLGLEVPDGTTPASIFERQWVLTLLANVLQQLRTECETLGKEALFQDLQPALQGDRDGESYAQVAARHGMSEGAVKVAVHRLRHRYAELLRAEIARTVSCSEEVDDELRHLMSVATR